MDALRPAVMLCAWGTSIFADYLPLFSDHSCTNCVRENKLYLDQTGGLLTPQISKNQQQETMKSRIFVGVAL